MKIRYVIYLLPLFIYITGCEKILDKTDLQSFSGSQIVNSLDLSKSYLNRIYNDNSPGWPGGDFMNCSEEVAGNTPYFEGTVTVNTVDFYGTSVSVDNIWGNLRAINQFIKIIDEGNLSEQEKKHLKGQALFFRAWDYFKLVRLYGGVPLVLEPQNAVGEDNLKKTFLARNKTSECIQQIVSDLDSAAAYLPGIWSNTDDWGRVTSGTALALEGRILLTWASPQFNPKDLNDR
ncbi:MAG TPA: RagB/SusD family nutrient uptake outer membrane protein, partial [Chitinophagaceae bacterium]|nr:RagB/SusD family nutrient uptake outer membrane protein [Chitinophagaceae bacterium]